MQEQRGTPSTLIFLDLDIWNLNFKFQLYSAISLLNQVQSPFIDEIKSLEWFIYLAFSPTSPTDTQAPLSFLFFLLRASKFYSLLPESLLYEFFCECRCDCSLLLITDSISSLSFIQVLEEQTQRIAFTFHLGCSSLILEEQTQRVVFTVFLRSAPLLALLAVES